MVTITSAISTPAKAVEGAASLYVPGTGGPATAVMPPLEGVYFDDTIYIYNGSASASKEFVVGGNVVAGLDATIVADFLTTLVVPSTNFLGGTLSMGVTVPVGAPMIDANAVVTGPFGNLRSLNVHDSALVVGDPVFNTMLGWKAGKLPIQASSMVNIPVGQLPDRVDELDADAPTVVYCAGGYRSSVAASVLRQRGFADVSDILGGYNAWEEVTQSA